MKVDFMRTDSGLIRATSAWTPLCSGTGETRDEAVQSFMESVARARMAGMRTAPVDAGGCNMRICRHGCCEVCGYPMHTSIHSGVLDGKPDQVFGHYFVPMRGQTRNMEMF